MTLLSYCIRPFPLDFVERFFKVKKKKISVCRPQLIKLYYNAMGRVDLIDAAVATYRIKFKGKKWQCAHFIGCNYGGSLENFLSH